MKIVLLLISFLFFMSSCASYQAGLDGKKKQKYGVTTGQPVWNKKRSSNSTKLLAPLAGASAGYLMSSGQTLTLGQTTYSENNTRTIYAAGGFVAGLGLNLLVNKLFSPSKKYKKSNQTKWLNAYNKVHRSNYIFPDPSNNTDTYVSIMRQEKYARYSSSYDNFLRQAENGNLDPREQSQALEKLNREFSILPEDKKLKLKSAVQDAKEAYAEKIIVNQLNQIQSMSNDLKRTVQYDRLKKSYYKEFNTMPLDKQEQYTGAIIRGMKNSIASYIKAKRSVINKFSLNDLGNVNTLNNYINEYSTSLKPLIFKYYFDGEPYHRDLINLKTKIVSNNLENLSNRIFNAKNLDQLKSIKESYLNHCNAQDENIILMTKALSDMEYITVKRLEREALLKKKEALLRKKIKLTETTSSGEPSQAQMQYAITNRLKLSKEQVERMTNVNPDDPLLLLSKVLGDIANDNEFELKAIQKIGCSESRTKPGYICDYTINIEVTKGAMAKTYNQLNEAFGNGYYTDRFLKVNGKWKLVERIK